MGFGTYLVNHWFDQAKLYVADTLWLVYLDDP